MCSHVSWKHIASKSKLSLLKSEIKDCISENVEFRDCTFSVKTVKLFLLFCRYDFTVFRSIYGENLSVAMSLSSLLLRIFIKMLTCVLPYGFKTYMYSLMRLYSNFIIAVGTTCAFNDCIFNLNVEVYIVHI